MDHFKISVKIRHNESRLPVVALLIVVALIVYLRQRH
jgi:hypothetical protein